MALLNLRDIFKYHAVRLASSAGWLTMVDPRFVSQYLKQSKSPAYRVLMASVNAYKPDALKRIVDVIASLCALIFLAPAFGLIAALTRTTSRGPVFSVSRRLGQNGRPFKLYKFRTLKTELGPMPSMSPSGVVLASMAADSRVTKFGFFLRQTSLDELPQFWNVLKGT